jgi:hypothetical protein
LEKKWRALNRCIELAIHAQAEKGISSGPVTEAEHSFLRIGAESFISLFVIFKGSCNSHDPQLGKCRNDISVLPLIRYRQSIRSLWGGCGGYTRPDKIDSMASGAFESVEAERYTL